MKTLAEWFTDEPKVKATRKYRMTEEHKRKLSEGRKKHWDKVRKGEKIKPTRNQKYHANRGKARKEGRLVSFLTRDKKQKHNIFGVAERLNITVSQLMQIMMDEFLPVVEKEYELKLVKKNK